MFKNRFFLYGLGIGLIAGSSLLQLMLQADRLERQPAASGQYYTAEEIEAIRQEARGSLEIKPPESPKPEGAAVAAALPPLQEVTAVTHAVYISNRMDASDVSVLFEEAGIVADRAALLSALAERGLTTRIRSGAYTFAIDTPIADIIAAITSNPL